MRNAEPVWISKYAVTVAVKPLTGIEGKIEREKIRQNERMTITALCLLIKIHYKLK